MAELAGLASNFNKIAVILAMAVLLAIAVRRQRRGKEMSANLDDEREYSGPEPTQAEIEAAERGILEKTAKAVQRAKRKARNSLVALLLTVGISVPFMAGMPLNAHFRPWGQLAILACGAAFFISVLACSGVVIAWLYKRDMRKWLDSARESE